MPGKVFEMLTLTYPTCLDVPFIMAWHTDSSADHVRQLCTSLFASPSI